MQDFALNIICAVPTIKMHISLNVSWISLGLIIVQFGYSLAGLDKFCTFERRREGPVQGSVCGSNLVQLVTDLCYPYGINSSGKKRSVVGPIEEVGLTDVFLKRADASNFLSKRRTFEKGITCECCYHRCSFGELMQYCSSPNIYAKRADDSPVSTASQ